MRIIVSGEQISFFERFGYVELESFIDDRRANRLLLAAEEEMEKRSRRDPSEFLGDPSTLYGYDLALSSEVVRKELFSLPLATAAFHFVRKKPLRYAFDSLWRIPGVSLEASLDSVSSVAPLMISVVIALTDQEETLNPTLTPFEYSLFPRQKGSVAFISSKTVFHTAAVIPGTYLLLAYASAQPVYRFQPSDPHTHFLKQYGYVFGDTLPETTHPVLYR